MEMNPFEEKWLFIFFPFRFFFDEIISRIAITRSFFKNLTALQIYSTKNFSLFFFTQNSYSYITSFLKVPLPVSLLFLICYELFIFSISFLISSQNGYEALWICTLCVNTHANALKYIQEIDSLF